MSNSLNFLNKPASTPKPAPYGPQPKPSTAAPKAAFLDKTNPWAVGGGAPTASAKTPAPRTQTPAPSTRSGTGQRAAIPSRGYNYTDASYTGATPQQRAREVDQAQMAAQATRQRREREAQAQAAAQPKPPIKVQAREFAQPVPPAPPPWAGPQAAEQPPIGLYMPTPQQRATAPKSLEQRAAEAWIRFVSSPTPEAARAAANQAQASQRTWNGTPPPFYDPETRFAEWQANQAQAAQQPQSPLAAPQSPLATPQQRTAAPAGASTAYQLDAPAIGTTPPIGRAAAPPALGTPAPAPTGTNVPTAQAAAPEGENQPPLFYGYTAPGPLTIERTAPLQGGQYRPRMTDRPLYTGYGQRAMLSDAQLATEYTQRQRDAAGSQANLTANYRPWSALTDAEKYQRRFGVMPQGAQMTPYNASGVAAQAASAAQHDRLVKEYWQRYAPVLGWVDPPLWQYESTPRMGRETIQRGPSGQAAPQAAPAAPTTKAAPVTVETTGNWQPTPGVSQEQANVAWIMQHNPKVATTRQPEEADLHAVAREIIGRYVPGIDPSTLTLFEVVRMMTSVYKPPPGMERPYGEDLKWLSSFISE